VVARPKRQPVSRRRLAFAAAAFAVALGVAGCEREPATPNPESESNFPSQLTTDYVTRHSRDAVPVWELFGDVAQKFDGDEVMHLNGVRMVFYRDGEEDAVLTSDTGQIHEETEATVARGNVVVVTEDGRRLESEELHWDPERELIHTEEFVRFTEGDQVLTGYGLETDPDLTNVMILRDVQGATRDESATPGNEKR